MHTETEISAETDTETESFRSLLTMQNGLRCCIGHLVHLQQSFISSITSMLN